MKEVEAQIARLERATVTGIESELRGGLVPLLVGRAAHDIREGR